MPPRTTERHLNKEREKDMGRRYANILETVGNTPVVRINKLAPAGVNLFVKIEAFNPLGSVKDRLALGVIEAAERRGTLKPGQTVVEATSGNTGIGLAMVCAAKGYPLVVTMAETFSVERRRLMRFLGAKVVLTPAAERGIGMVNKANELAAAHGWFLTRQFENEANADMHSRTTAREIVEDFKDTQLDYWVTGYGTGGTLKGVARVLAKEMPNTKIVVCEPTDAAMLTSGTGQQRKPDGSPAAAHPAFKPHPMQGWAPDFIPKLIGDVVDTGHDPQDPADRRSRRAALQPRPGAEGGHLRRHHRRRHLRRRAAGRRRSADGRQHPGDAARHRRALPQHAAVRRHPRRHDRGGAEDLAVNAGRSHEARGMSAERRRRVLRLSVLDQSTVVTGRSPDTSIRESLALAKHCEALGYSRYWCAEHHNSASQAGTAPEILISAIAATTTRIRVGSAGVMLPHYSSLKVAEQFRVLEAIAPGRIDLGLGRAPGSDGRTAFALNPLAETAADHFPAQVRDLLAWLAGEKLMEGHPFRDIIAQPGGPTMPGGLGARQFGLRPAGRGVFRPAVLLRAFHHRRPRRRAGDGAVSRGLPAKRASSDAACARCASGRWRRRPRRRPRACSPRARCGGWDATAACTPPCPRPRKPPRIRIHRSRNAAHRTAARRALYGTPAVVGDKLRALAAQHGVEEIAILTTLHDPEARRRSYTLLAHEFALQSQVPLAAE